MCRSVTVPSLRATQHSPSAWANFAPKLTTMLTGYRSKNPVIAHIAFLRRVVTNHLEHGGAIVQHDSWRANPCGCLRRMLCWAPTSSSRRMVREINCLLSWNLAIEIDEQRVVVHLRRKVFPSLMYHADVGDPADRSHHPPPSPQQCHHLPRTSC